MHESEGESGLAVFTDADWIAQLGQPAAQALGGLDFKRCECLRPLPGLRVVPLAQFRRQQQQPGQSVGSLVRRAPWCLEVGDFASDASRRQAPGKCCARLRCERRLWKLPREAREQPVPVHGRVPVIAAEKRRCQFARRAHVCITAQRMRNLVGVLQVRAMQRKVGEPSRCGFVERWHGDTDTSRREQADQNERPHRECDAGQ